MGKKERVNLDPQKLTYGSGKIANWTCSRGHNWNTSIYRRTVRGTNCPYCSNKKILSGYNDLQSQRPDLMEEWDYERNKEIDPTGVGRGSHLYAFWSCHKCGYKWDAQIYNRANGKGCPCCANRIVVPGINDLATTSPELASEWHPVLNSLNPTEVTKGQAKEAFWICSKCGHVWKDTINHRSNGRGCKKCKKSK